VFTPPLRLTGFHLAFSHDRSKLTATLHLSGTVRPDAVDCAFAHTAVVVASFQAHVATCTWSLPTRFRGHRLTGAVSLGAHGATLLVKRFHVRVPKR